MKFLHILPALIIGASAISLSACNGSEGRTDGGLDAGPDGGPDAGAACTKVDPPPFKPDVGRKKFALSMFHFNEQYVAGGLDVTLKDGTRIYACGEPCKGWVEKKYDDWYITQTFEPTLDLYLAHPNWKVDIEFQGYLLELIAERYPRVLEKLRAGAASGQFELVSIHYSDQLFIAFPRADLQKSVDLTKRLFDSNCVPLSGVVFNQEGEDGEGKHAFMADNGYSIDVYPDNLFRYYYQKKDKSLFYKSRGVDVVIGPGDGYRSGLPPVIERYEPYGIEVTWTYLDDGDMMAYPPDPYFAPFSTKKDIADNIAKYEAKLTDLEQQGFKITSVGDFVAHLKAGEVEQPAFPPILDGTWQPIDTDSVWRWMGGRSLAPYANLERDNTVRSYNYRTRTDCAAAQILLDTAAKAGKGTSELEPVMLTAWKELMLAEVTDATGITPWQGEFNYGIVHTDNAAQGAGKVITGALGLLGWPHAKIDLSTGGAERIEAVPIPEAPKPAQAPFEAALLAPTRTSSINWYEAGVDTYLLEVTFGAAADKTGYKEANSRVTLSLPRYEDRYLYSPALLDGEVADIDMAQFDYQAPEVYLPLANGLIGLGDGWWVVKDCRKVNLAARIPNQGDRVIQFVDATADPENGDGWTFYIIKGDKIAALDLARRINTGPTVYK